MIIKIEQLPNGKVRVTIPEICNVVIDKPPVIAVVADAGINLELQKRVRNNL